MSRDTRIVAAFLAAIAVTIGGGATAVTLAIANGASSLWRLPFRLVCHGIVRRCLDLGGTPMPICARCLGIYAGFLLGIVLFPLVRGLSERAMGIILLIAVMPLAVDGVTQAVRLRESTNPLRLATGLAAGAAFGMWALGSVETRARQRFASS